MKSDVRAMAIERFALEAFASEAISHYTAQVAKRVTPIEWEKLTSCLTNRERDDLQQIRERMITPAEIGLVREVLAECGNYPTLYAGDKLYMSEIRCSVLDAVELLAKGKLHAAYRALVTAEERLEWLLHGRKRDGFESKRMIPVDVLPRLMQTHIKTRAVTAMVGRAAAAVS